VKTLPLNHTSPAIGFRLEFSSFDLAYITDTRVDNAYFPLARDVDLLVHECNFPSDMAEWADKTGHTETRSFIKMFGTTLAKKVAITHLNAFDESINKRIAGELINAIPDVIIPEDNTIISLERGNVRTVDK